MNRRFIRFGLTGCVAVFLFTSSSFAGNFFSITSVEYESPSHPEAGGRLKVRVQTREVTRSSQVFAKAYIFDDREKMVASWSAPNDVPRANSDHYAMPAIFQKQRPEDIYFGVPANLLGKRWVGLVVFGDANEAVAKTFGGSLSPLVNYPEKNLVENRSGAMVERKAAIDPLVETVVTIPNPQHPQMTLFFRMPDGVSNVNEINGTLAMCLLADNVGSIRRQLQGIKPGEEVNGLLRYANQRKLGVLCWGHQRLVNSNGFARAQEADSLAAAWERGVADLHTKYAMPAHDYLLWGVCQAAISASRLVLRKPDYFLGVFIHIPPYLEQPTAQANKVLWLLTSGELDPGYPGCIAYYKQCRALNYPMIFKPIAGLGHSDSSISYDLAYKFFDYALSVKQQRLAYDQALKDPIAQMRFRNAGNQIWASGFQQPAYYGDYLNQECYAAKQADMIPAALRVPLPTKELADLWNK